MLHSRIISPSRSAGKRARFVVLGCLPVLLSLIIALSVYAQAGSSPPPLAQPSATDVRVNQVTTADQQEPTLAVDPTNPNNVLSAAKDWRTGPKQVWYYRSTDGGRTWADGHVDFPTELPNQSDPAISFDAAGVAYMSVLGYNQNDFTIGGLFITKSSDAGATWQKPVLVSANSSTFFNDKEWITTDRGQNSATKGNVYTTWTLFTNQGTRSERGDIVLSRSTDGGRTFSGRTLVSLPTQANNQGSFPAVGPNGEVFVLYFSGPNAVDPDQGRASGDASQERQVAPQQQGQGGEALYVAKSTDGGRSFAQVKKAASITFPPSPLPGSKFRLFVLPTLAVDPNNGALYATWNDYSSGESDVLLVRSTDGGVNWSAPVRVNDDPRQARHDHFFPTVVVGHDSVVHLLWLDRRDDPQNKTYLPYYTSSTDGGVTFAKNVPVSLTASNPDVGFQGTLIGDYISLDVSGDGSTVYTAWVDTRGGTQDIYFSQFPSKSGPNVPPGSGQPVTPTPEAVPSPQPLTGFSDEAFLRAWERADRPVATGYSNRPWVWGPVSFASALEPYAQGSSGNREVQYFDKARMEINNPGGDRSSPFFVTNGLLVVEMMSGRIQTGDAQFEPPRIPSQVPVAGDANSPDALTYASLASVASLNNDKRAQDRTGQAVTATLNREGQVGDDPTKSGQVQIVRYESTLGHNIPDVFWNFMNTTGPTYNGRLNNYSNGPLLNWETDLGYPITEPYWTNVKINGVAKSVLVQAFQRRVLTFVADNPQGWQVEMGNVGRQYYDWRYNQPGKRRTTGK